MTDVKLVKLEEQLVSGRRLGRHVEHDPRSREYAYEADITDYKSVTHHRYGGVFDQGNLGSCTGNACAGAINTVPLRDVAVETHSLHEQDAIDLYELATSLDKFPGVYPPDDTGSTGLAVAKAAKSKGYVTSYKHAFSMDAALAALQKGPVITGVNWYEGFDNPDSTGLVEISGQVRGGHEFEILGFQLANDIHDSLVVAENSWGRSWGVSGRFNFTVSTWQQLLDEQGDVTILFHTATA